MNYLVLFIIGITFVNAFRHNSIVNEKAINGIKAEPGQFRFSANLVRKYERMSYVFICHASIISDKYILSHYQCKSVYRMYAIAGYKNDWDRTVLETEMIGVSTVIFPPTRHKYRKEDSLMLVVLEKDITSPNVVPAALLRNPVHDVNVTVIGWHNDHSAITFFSVPLIHKNFCKEKIKEACRDDYEIADYEFCTDEPHGTDLSTNWYDLGSPIQVRDGVIVGVVSETGTEDMDGCPGVHIAISEFEEFINLHVPKVTWVDE